MPTTDVVSITFEGDARLTVLQILSVDRLFDHSGIERYVIVLNGQDNDRLGRYLRGHLARVASPALREKIVLVEAEQLIGSRGEIGWRDQQLIKLMVARSLSTDYYLLLDAKNHFVHRCSLADFFDGDRPVSHFTPTNSSWMPYVKASLRVFGVDEHEYSATSPPTITPYVMIRSEVVSLLDRLESIFGTDAGAAFDEQLRQTTEFFLYYAHLMSVARPYPYAPGHARVTTLYTRWPQKHEDVMRLITNATSPKVPVFGLHRLRFPQLNDIQRDAIERLWLQELLKPEDDPSWFVASPEMGEDAP